MTQNSRTAGGFFISRTPQKELVLLWAKIEFGVKFGRFIGGLEIMQ
jgi:hypothetical protein